VSVEISDVHFIVGPSLSAFADAEDPTLFDQDIRRSNFDSNNPLNNLVEMHRRMKAKNDREKAEQQAELDKAKAEKAL